MVLIALWSIFWVYLFNEQYIDALILLSANVYLIMTMMDRDDIFRAATVLRLLKESEDGDQP